MQVRQLSNDEIRNINITKTQMLIGMVDDLQPNEGGALIELDESTSQQTFRTIINRHYKGARKFTIKTTEKGLLVIRIK